MIISSILDGRYCIWLHDQYRDAGGGGARAPPKFGILVNPIRTKGGRLCPPYYYWPPHLFGRCGASELIVYCNYFCSWIRSLQGFFLSRAKDLNSAFTVHFLIDDWLNTIFYSIVSHFWEVRLRMYSRLCAFYDIRKWLWSFKMTY